jgi:hypothetical protein
MIRNFRRSEQKPDLSAHFTDLLTQIGRGNLVSAIEEREANGSDYAAADFFTQLDASMIISATVSRAAWA